MRRARALAAAALVCAGALVAGCSQSKAPGVDVTPSGAVAAQALSLLATKGVKEAYDATYDVAATTGRNAETRVRLSPPLYRVDITEGSATAILIGGTPRGAFSCRTAPKTKPTCFSVALSGKTIPKVFDPGVQKVFTFNLIAFAQRPDAFDVTEVDPHPAGEGTPSGRCFRVTPKAVVANVSAAFKDIDQGTYCLSSEGVPVHLEFSSGTMTITQYDAKRPPNADFYPPAIPKQLPPVKKTPTPKPSASSTKK